MGADQRKQFTPPKPPGPFLQAVNAALHREPLNSLAHGMYWSLFFLTVTPFLVLFLWLQTLWQLWCWYTTRGRPRWDPVDHQDVLEMGVLITGCDSGFGQLLAHQAGKQGFTVFACCLKSESFAQYKGLPKVKPLLVDVTNNDQVLQAVAQVQAWLDEKSNCQRVLHAVINNAGIGEGGLVDWISVDDFERFMNVHLFGMVRICKAVLPILKHQSVYYQHRGHARIFNFASTAGQILVTAALAAYSASKHAAVAFSGSLRVELRAWDIQVCTVCPGTHETPLTTEIGNFAASRVDALSESVREEYGEAYLDEFVNNMFIPQQVMWKAQVVTDRVMFELMAARVAPEIFIGLDARFIVAVLRMVPAWGMDLLGRLQWKITPAAMNHDEAGPTEETKKFN